MTDAQIELPRWRCHKVVHATKITAIAGPDESGSYSLQLLVDGSPQRFAYTKVGPRFMERHGRQVLDGGYYVVYEDGYASWSPAKAFEEGYTRVLDTDPRIPCGQVLGHGDSCQAGHLCKQCGTILELRAAVSSYADLLRQYRERGGA